MSNVFFATILFVFTAFGLYVFIQSIIRRRERDGSLYFQLMCISNALWAICNALFYLIPDVDLALRFFEFRLCFICFSSIFTYLFVLKSIRHITLSPKTHVLICLIPITTAILTLTDASHNLVRTRIEVYLADGIRMISNENGPWFWIHSLTCYLFLFITARLMLGQYRRLPPDYRLPITIMLVGLFSTMATTLLSVFDLFPYSFDPSPVTIQVAQIIFFFTLFNAHSMDVLFTSRDAIFENATSAIFILNSERHILDYNRNALKMSHDIALQSPYDMPFQELLDDWLAAHSGHYFTHDNSIVTIHREAADEHFQLTVTDFRNKYDQVIGSYVEFSNITPTMSLVHMLQDAAYIDQLTGLLNRRSFNEQIIVYNTEENYPLGLVVGDVNQLKRVNDTYGHVVGDLLLQDITRILKVSSPSNGRWFRMGGDEFVGLFPNTNQKAMGDLLESIERRCGSFEDERFKGAGIATAFRIQYDAQQDIHALLDDADHAMYVDKRDRRKNRGTNPPQP